MTLKTGIAGIALRINEQTLTITSRRGMRILSSAVLNGGLTRSRLIVNHHVPKNSHSRNPEKYLQRILRRKNLDQNAVGLMTAAEMGNAAVRNTRDAGFPICTVVTAGTSNALAAGEYPRHVHAKTGTINTIVLLDANPTDACLVEIVKTATEAKSLALRETDILSRVSNKTATGTSTDTVTVAATDRGKPIKYAGTATLLGSVISRSVIQAVKKGIGKQDGISSSRSLVVRLRERGLTPEKTVRIVLERLRRRLKTKPRRHLKSCIEALVNEIFKKREIASLVVASLRMFENSSSAQINVRTARALGEDISRLIGGEQAVSLYRKSSKETKPPSWFVIEGLMSALVASALDTSEPRCSWWKV